MQFNHIVSSIRKSLSSAFSFEFPQTSWNWSETASKCDPMSIDKLCEWGERTPPTSSKLNWDGENERGLQPMVADPFQVTMITFVGSGNWFQNIWKSGKPFKCCGKHSPVRVSCESRSVRFHPNEINNTRIRLECDCENCIKSWILHNNSPIILETLISYCWIINFYEIRPFR